MIFLDSYVLMFSSVIHYEIMNFCLLSHTFKCGIYVYNKLSSLKAFKGIVGWKATFCLFSNKASIANKHYNSVVAQIV